jgi:putative ABC transport system permease protein
LKTSVPKCSHPTTQCCSVRRFAEVALLIAVVGVGGVLAFSVSGRTREFGIRLAVGSQPRHLLIRVIAEGAAMAIGGLAAGVACGFGLAQLAALFWGI